MIQSAEYISICTATYVTSLPSIITEVYILLQCNHCSEEHIIVIMFSEVKGNGSDVGIRFAEKECAACSMLHAVISLACNNDRLNQQPAKQTYIFWLDGRAT